MGVASFLFIFVIIFVYLINEEEIMFEIVPKLLVHL